MNTAHNITTIIFDLSEVYLKGLYKVEEKLEPILNISSAEIFKILNLPEEDKAFDLLMLGKISEDEYWKKILAATKWPISLDALKKAARDNFTEIEGTREIILKLREKGLKLGLLSNHCKEWIGYCEKKFDYHKLFHETAYSFEIGASKPDKKSYQYILKKLNAKPKECLFIDDSKKNIQSAEKLGIKGICFKTPSQLKKELNKIEFEI